MKLFGKWKYAFLYGCVGRGSPGDNRNMVEGRALSLPRGPTISVLSQAMRSSQGQVTWQRLTRVIAREELLILRITPHYPLRTPLERHRLETSLSCIRERKLALNGEGEVGTPISHSFIYCFFSLNINLGAFFFSCNIYPLEIWSK